MSPPSPDLSILLDRVISNYPEEQIGDALVSHETRTAIEDQIPSRLGDLLDDRELTIEGSVGKGRWTSIPWIAIMDPRETTGVQQGLYIVYLFEPQEDRVRLCLGIGVTSLMNELGVTAAREELEAATEQLRSMITTERFADGPAEFPHASNRNQLYGPGTVCYTEYQLGDMPDEAALADDLRALVEIYDDLIPTAENDRVSMPGGERPGRREPTVYQVPINSSQGKIRENFDQTVLQGVPREQLEGVEEVPIDEDRLRLWGNQASEAAEPGDYLLFAQREGRYEGEYLVLARIESAAILPEEDAKAFTKAVGWGDGTGPVFPHKMFLKPVWEADLDREEFWNLLGFHGWPNDTYSAIDFDRDQSSFYATYDSIIEFVESIKGERLYPNGSNSELPPAGVYESIDGALSDLRDRLGTADAGLEWFQRRVSRALLEDWAVALDGFNPSDQVSPAAGARFDQIRAIFQTLEPTLEARAAQWGVGTLQDLTEAETLYLGCIRILFEDQELDGAPLSQPHLNSILNDTYRIESSLQPAVRSSRSGHPLLSILAEADGGRAVHHLTAPPDFWITSIRRRAISFEPDDEAAWERVNPGDIVLLHSRSTPGNAELDTQPNGFVGAAILGDRFRKPEEEWWWDEVDRDTTFPYLVGLQRLFVTADLDQIDQSESILDQDNETIRDDVAALTADALDFSVVNERCRAETGRELAAQGSFSTFRQEGELEYERPRIVLEELAPRLTETAAVDIHRDVSPTLSPDILDGLYFPDDQAVEILEEIEAALRSGKHVILTGPPGTGKTEIARQVAEALTNAYPSLYSGTRTTTATADWSTFDTVGGYMPEEAPEPEGQESLTFTPGTVLNRLQARDRRVPIDEPLVIDELNRANIDKAFGQLFTVLSGQAVSLPQTRDGVEIEILPASELSGSPQPNQFVIPRAWRLFATMNTYDKTSLYEMSYAFMRRFAFVRVGVPSLEDRDGDELRELVMEYVAVWNDSDLGIDLRGAELEGIGRVWQQTNTAVEDRAIGPAIIRDLVSFVDNHPGASIQQKMTRAVIAYIFPQLEGVPKRKDIIDNIATVDVIDDDTLREVAREMLQVTFEES